jgi:hypothetical protein
MLKEASYILMELIILYDCQVLLKIKVFDDEMGIHLIYQKHE